VRLDLWLSKVCLLKSRSQAKSGCHSGRILLGGSPVKESRELRGGEEITLIFPQRELCLRVLAIPAGNIARRDAASCYELLADRPRREDF
jgi:ribosomal 50S subunit-recycling heat shock protein